MSATRNMIDIILRDLEYYVNQDAEKPLYYHPGMPADNRMKNMVFKSLSYSNYLESNRISKDDLLEACNSNFEKAVISDSYDLMGISADQDWNAAWSLWLSILAQVRSNRGQ